MGAARRAIISINWNRLFGKANNGGPKRSHSLCRGGARRRISRGGAGKRRQRLRLQRSREPARSQTRCAIAQPHHAQHRRDRGGGAPARAGPPRVPALGEVEAAVDVVNAFRDRPAGTLRLNVPATVARLVLPSIVAPFLKAYPDIRLEVIVEDAYVDVLATGCDAGIRYDERLEQDMIAVPIGPRGQLFATAASPDYLAAHGVPEHPRDLLGHACLRGQFASGVIPTWEFEKDGE